MRLNQLKIIFILFFFSGMAGLIYEISWGRLLVLIFGSTTNSIVAVVSAFLGGLALGSLIAGKFADNLRQKSLIQVYSYLEAGVGILGLATLMLIPEIRNIYSFLSDGSEVGINLLIIKFILAAIIILLPTSLMGATLPILVKLAQYSSGIREKIVSLLYAVNTFGGVLGVALAAFVLIELIGLQYSIVFAALINFGIALIAKLLLSRDQKSKLEIKKEKTSFFKLLTPFTSLVLISFFFSGLISVALQILWTRVLTPGLGTVIYAFASILIIFLFGIAFGSLTYQKISSFFKSKLVFFALLEGGIGLSVLLSVLFMHKFELPGFWELILRVLPPTLLMGLTFPAVIALIEEKSSTGKIVGLSYFSNTLGTILGGFLASLILIPKLGSSQSIVFLSIFNFILAALFFGLEKNNFKFKLLGVVTFALLILFTTYLVTQKADRLYPLKTDYLIADAKLRELNFGFKEDEIASVFAVDDTKNKEVHLIIDGVETTHRVAETRLMAHIPITLHPSPKSMLVIAFGMGTTFRSALKQGLQVDAIELVPSVPSFMYLFHSDASQILANPKGKIIINDGRNYAFLTHKKYDLVVIDPPPPFNTAGSTVLHSREFYLSLAKNLNQGGIVSQWIYYNRSREDEISMAIKSFVEVFPYVLAVQNKDSVGGMYLEGSFSPMDPKRLETILTQQIVKNDLQEIYGDLADYSGWIKIEVIGDKQSLEKVVAGYPPITDNNPRSEYYLIRQNFSNSPLLVTDKAHNFINKIKSRYQP